MIYMYHMDDLISENSVSKLQEQIYGICFHRLLKTHNQFTYLRKYEALLNWEKNIYSKVRLTLCPPLRHVCVSERDQHPLWQWLVAYSVPSHGLNKCWLFINWTIVLWIKKWQFSLQKMDLEMSSAKCSPFCPSDNGLNNMYVSKTL